MLVFLITYECNEDGLTKREDEEWAEQYHEDAVDPEIEILDAHHHLFDFLNHDKGLPAPKFIRSLGVHGNVCFFFNVFLKKHCFGTTIPKK